VTIFDLNTDQLNDPDMIRVPEAQGSRRVAASTGCVGLAERAGRFSFI